MFEAVEQIVFLAACRIHFDRVMRLGRAAISFDVRFFTVHPGIVPHDIDLHELTGFEAVGIAIAAAGVCFVQRVGRCRVCGIHHAEVWHRRQQHRKRRQQHRKRKQHRQQLLFESSSCFHVSSCFSFIFFYRKENSATHRTAFVKGLKKGCGSTPHPFALPAARFLCPAGMCESVIFFSKEKGSILSILPSHFAYFLPQEEALVVGIWSFAFIERIFLFSRRDAEKIDISCLAAALLDHL